MGRQPALRLHQSQQASRGQRQEPRPDLSLSRLWTVYAVGLRPRVHRCRPHHQPGRWWRRRPEQPARDVPTVPQAEDPAGGSQRARHVTALPAAPDLPVRAVRRPTRRPAGPGTPGGHLPPGGSQRLPSRTAKDGVYGSPAFASGPTTPSPHRRLEPLAHPAASPRCPPGRRVGGFGGTGRFTTPPQWLLAPRPDYHRTTAASRQPHGWACAGQASRPRASQDAGPRGRGVLFSACLGHPMTGRFLALLFSPYGGCPLPPGNRIRRTRREPRPRFPHEPGPRLTSPSDESTMRDRHPESGLRLTQVGVGASCVVPPRHRPGLHRREVPLPRGRRRLGPAASVCPRGRAQTTSPLQVAVLTE